MVYSFSAVEQLLRVLSCMPDFGFTLTHRNMSRSA